MNKLKQHGFGAIAFILVIVLVAGAGFTAFRVFSSDTTDTTTNQTTQNSNAQTQQIVEGRDGIILEAEIVNDKFYRVELIASDAASIQEYIGKIEEINQDNLRLTAVFYNQTQNDQLTLVKLGNEIHAPFDAMYLPITSVSKVEVLAAESPEQGAIDSYSELMEVSDAWPSESIEDYIAADLHQAVFMDDGAVYFGNLVNIQDSVFMQGNVYEFVANETGASLGLADRATLDAYQREDVLFWQNIQTDGQISSAITQFESADIAPVSPSN